jgi:hypothetical protein
MARMLALIYNVLDRDLRSLNVITIGSGTVGRPPFGGSQSSCLPSPTLHRFGEGLWRNTEQFRCSGLRPARPG